MIQLRAMRGMLILAVLSAGIGSAQASEISLNYFRAFPQASKGYELMRDGKRAEAIPYFEQAVAVMPEHTTYRAQLIALLLNEGRTERADEILRAGIERKPDDPHLQMLAPVVEGRKQSPGRMQGVLMALREKFLKNHEAHKSQLALIESLVRQEPVEPLKPMEKDKTKAAQAAPVPPQVDVCERIGRPASLSPRQNMDAGYCALRRQKTAQAIAHFEAAKQDQALSTQADRQLGYLYLDTDRPEKAVSSWRNVTEREDDASARLMLVHSLRRAGDVSAALVEFDTLGNDQLDAAQRRQYTDEATALSGGLDDTAESILVAERILQHAPTAEGYYYQAIRRQKLGQMQAAVADLEQARRLAPDNRLYAISLAYAYRGENMNREAIPHFAYALENQEYDHSREDYAYTLKDEGEREPAAQQFRHILPQKESPEKATGLRREIQQLEDNWQSTASLTYRDGVARAAGVPGLQNYEDSYQYGFESIYSPDSWQREGRRVQLFGQMFVSSDTGQFNWNEGSTQGALGIRATPLAETEWYVYASRLIGLGEEAIDDWQVRTTYAYTKGLDIRPYEEQWTYLFITPDISYIVDRSELYASVEARYGRSFRHHENWVATPHLVLAGAHQDTPNESNDAIEAGLGLSWKYWFAATSERAPRGSAELLLQYRAPIVATDSEAGPYIRLVLQY